MLLGFLFALLAVSSEKTLTEDETHVDRAADARRRLQNFLSCPAETGWDFTDAGQFAFRQCGSAGAQGSELQSRYCAFDGSGWFPPFPACTEPWMDKSTSCPPMKEGGVDWPETDAGQTATLNCLDGSDISRYCAFDGSGWFLPTPMACPDGSMSSWPPAKQDDMNTMNQCADDGMWASTAGGMYAWLDCPDGQKQSRYCSYDGSGWKHAGACPPTNCVDAYGECLGPNGTETTTCSSVVRSSGMVGPRGEARFADQCNRTKTRTGDSCQWASLNSCNLGELQSSACACQGTSLIDEGLPICEWVGCVARDSAHERLCKSKKTFSNCVCESSKVGYLCEWNGSKSPAQNRFDRELQCDAKCEDDLSWRSQNLSLTADQQYGCIYYSSPQMQPFCSERNADLDLGTVTDATGNRVPKWPDEACKLSCGICGKLADYLINDAPAPDTDCTPTEIQALDAFERDLIELGSVDLGIAATGAGSCRAHPIRGQGYCCPNPENCNLFGYNKCVFGKEREDCFKMGRDFCCEPRGVHNCVIESPCRPPAGTQNRLCNKRWVKDECLGLDSRYGGCAWDVVESDYLELNASCVVGTARRSTDESGNGEYCYQPNSGEYEFGGSWCCATCGPNGFLLSSTREARQFEVNGYNCKLIADIPTDMEVYCCDKPATNCWGIDSLHDSVCRCSGRNDDRAVCEANAKCEWRMQVCYSAFNEAGMSVASHRFDRLCGRFTDNSTCHNAYRGKYCRFETMAPTGAPSDTPTVDPTDGPTTKPTRDPTSAPSRDPTDAPSRDPTDAPSEQPTQAPTYPICNCLSYADGGAHHEAIMCESEINTCIAMPATGVCPRLLSIECRGNSCDEYPLDPSCTCGDDQHKGLEGPPRVGTEGYFCETTNRPTEDPTNMPTRMPSQAPTEVPSAGPTSDPTRMPSQAPSQEPSSGPTSDPSLSPTVAPSAGRQFDVCDRVSGDFRGYGAWYDGRVYSYNRIDSETVEYQVAFDLPGVSMLETFTQTGDVVAGLTATEDRQLRTFDENDIVWIDDAMNSGHRVNAEIVFQDLALPCFYTVRYHELGGMEEQNVAIDRVDIAADIWDFKEGDELVVDYTACTTCGGRGTELPAIISDQLDGGLYEVCYLDNLIPFSERCVMDQSDARFRSFKSAPAFQLGDVLLADWEATGTHYLAMVTRVADDNMFYDIAWWDDAAMDFDQNAQALNVHEDRLMTPCLHVYTAGQANRVMVQYHGYEGEWVSGYIESARYKGDVPFYNVKYPGINEEERDVSCHRIKAEAPCAQDFRVGEAVAACLSPSVGSDCVDFPDWHTATVTDYEPLTCCASVEFAEDVYLDSEPKPIKTASCVTCTLDSCNIRRTVWTDVYPVGGRVEVLFGGSNRQDTWTPGEVAGRVKLRDGSFTYNVDYEAGDYESSVHAERIRQASPVCPCGDRADNGQWYNTLLPEVFGWTGDSYACQRPREGGSCFPQDFQGSAVSGCNDGEGGSDDLEEVRCRVPQSVLDSV